MKLIENIKNWWYDTKDQYHQYLQDKKMKKLFPKIIKDEVNDRESFFNQNNMRSTDNFNEVVLIIDIPEEYQLKGQPWQIMDKLNENSYFVSKYLKESLQFGDNVSMPEYYHIEDPSSATPFSCRYMAVWTYAPVLKSKKKIYIIKTSIYSLITGGLGILGFILLL